MERSKRARLVSISILGLVFATGFVVGIAVDRSRIGLSAGSDPVAEADGEERGERVRRSYLWERVEGLTPEQVSRIEGIVASYRDSSRALWKHYDTLIDPLREEHQRRFRSLVDSARLSIRAIMTEEQAGRYDSLHQEMQWKREERREDRDERPHRRGGSK